MTDRSANWALRLDRFSLATPESLSRGIGPRSHPDAATQRRLYDAIAPDMPDYAVGYKAAREQVYRAVADALMRTP